MTRLPICVVKVGGSLLAQPQLAERLQSWLDADSAERPQTHHVLLVGGGKLVDAVREIDAVRPLGDEAAHWLCVALLNVTARLLGAMLPELEIVDQFSTLKERLRTPGRTLFAPGEFLRQVEPTCDGVRLPYDWSVTSDAIAGRLAIVLGADKLVLLKSVPPPVPPDGPAGLARLAAVGYVDSFLSELVSRLPHVRCASLGGDCPVLPSVSGRGRKL